MRRVTQAWWGLLFGLLLCLPAQARSHYAHAAAATSTIAVSDLPPEARTALQLIKQGGPFPYGRDGVTFGNYEHALPPQPRGYYREYTVHTPGVRGRGPRRIVCGTAAACYYSDDHYRTFRLIEAASK